METMRRFASRFAADHPTEAARRLEGLTPRNVASFFEKADPATAAAVLDRMAPPIAASCIGAMDIARGSEVVGLLPVDRGIRLLRHLDPEHRAHILRLLPGKLAEQAERTLRFPEGSAGGLADGSVIPLPTDMTVNDALRVARDPRFPYVYVVDRDHILVGVVHKREVQAGSENTTLDSIMTPNATRVPAHAAAAELHRHPAWRDLDALPVVDRRGVYVGAIRHKRLRGVEESRSAIGGAAAPLGTLLDVAEVYWIGLASVVAALAEGSAESREEGRGNDR
jgi:magnesium transporter